MNSKEISIIIPTLNVGKYISHTLNSLTSQTFKDFEVIFVDGGSTDNTVEIIKNTLKDAPFPWRIITERKKGVSTARNRGIKESQGKFIYFLDGDDYISPQCLEIAHKKITKENADIVFFGYSIIKGNAREDNIPIFPHPSCTVSSADVIKKILLGEIQIWTHSALYKKQLIVSNNIQFSEGISRGEDFEFIIKALFHANKVTCVEKTLAYHVLRDGSLSQEYSIKDFEWIAAKKKVYYYLKKHDAPKEILDLLWYVDIPNMLVGILRRIYLSTLAGKFPRNNFLNIIRNPEIQATLRRLSLHYSRGFSTYVLSRIFIHHSILLPIYTQYLKIRKEVR